MMTKWWPVPQAQDMQRFSGDPLLGASLFLVSHGPERHPRSLTKPIAGEQPGHRDCFTSTEIPSCLEAHGHRRFCWEQRKLGERPWPQQAVLPCLPRPGTIFPFIPIPPPLHHHSAWEVTQRPLLAPDLRPVPWPWSPLASCIPA